ncbi:preprotein translocase subunit SecD [Natronoglomus mannanivorans]|uniref:Protein-export membrane protein SecD n=1 Tax=Natronoglomus mannanivorans TaxID=2979990 RepID=A0AAP2YW86_9EURY|nr:preprotein translocase subunit SecD [Halobacteria archaeon AArc-xg1-1]
MGLRDFIKAYWRIILLIVFVSVALVALFIPGGIFADDSIGDGTAVAENGTDGSGTAASVETTQGWTNLVYGLSLDGGTRVSAPVVGMTAENLEIDPDREIEVSQTLRDELELDPADVMLRFDERTGTYTAEVFTKNVSQSEFAGALQTAEVDATEDDIREGVTQATRDEMIGTIDTKINEAGLSGGRVSQSDIGGQFYIVTEVPDWTPQELRNHLSERGIVRVVAHYPDGNGSQTNETVLEQGDFASISPPDYNDRSGHHVPVTVRSDIAPDYQQRMNDIGFTNEGVGQCDYENPGAEGQNYCLLTVVDGEVVDSHSMGGDLAQNMRSGDWANDPRFIMGAPNQQEAQSLSINLRAGSLRAPLDFENDQTFTLEPALADQFKVYSLIIGVISVLTVSGVVYLRYADARVAAPMIVTALAEVVILLGFAAAIRMPLGLPEVAGFIAVVGTGVDDLIIIADEVMSEGDVNSRRVFESRFRKAFWVIGAAAGTTIIAMSPLAVLNLGDLQGFAIITILGVLIGVLITRPAYGDILRYLLTDR